MKIQITLGLAIILLTLIFFPISVIALSPGPRVRECGREESSGNLSEDCAKVLCEWDNANRNWPINTGYYVDCEKSSSLLVTNNLIYIVPVAFIIVISLVLIIRKRKKKSGLPITKEKVT